MNDKRRDRIKQKVPTKRNGPELSVNAVDLRHRAEVQLRDRNGIFPPPLTEADTKRLLHELQVHELELQMQNAELEEARAAMETLLETYTDLYDFAPVGYFSVDEQGLILEANLAGAALLGVDRSRLVKRRLHGFVEQASRPSFLAFFGKIFEGPGKQICETSLLNERGMPFWVDLQAMPAASLKGERKWCRMAISDLTTLKREEEVRRRLEVLANANRKMKKEIVRRQKVEAALKKSETHYLRLFEQSLHMQGQLRHLSRQLLLAQEEERKRISRELHDEIVQTLVGIHVHLASLKVKKGVSLQDFGKKINQTQRLVEKSVNIVHRFARELRPTVLDDLGLIPALQSFIQEFTKRTRILVHFGAFAGVEKLNSTQRTVLYRVAQSALANVDKHARAKNVKMEIRKLGGTIRLEIHDDGRSFEVERVLLAKRHKRLGLLGSRERVEMIGGKFNVESEPGHGTTVRAEIPIIGEGCARSSRKAEARAKP